MELDVLDSHIMSSPATSNLAALVQRIANKELPHGADIVIGIHTRLLKRLSLSLTPGALALSESVNAKDKSGPCQAHKPGTQSESLPLGAGVSEPALGVPSQAPANIAIPTATLTKGPDAGTEERK